MTITPLILGSGMAGQAIAKGFSILNLLHPELQIAPAIHVARGRPLEDLKKEHEHPVLCIATPHALHAPLILEASAVGFEAILCEKPSCVTIEQVEALSKVETPTAVLHGYRQMWGPQTLKKLIKDNEFGAIMAIEGKYWQSSVAAKALQSRPEVNKGWKNDPNLSGPFDVFLDLGSHWVDTTCFLLDSVPDLITGRKFYTNSDADHKDSHVQLNINYKDVSAFTSVSKTVHGATNAFEINILGSHKSAKWEFLKPDEISLGEGRETRTMIRTSQDLGSKLPSFHALGWLEGYLEISRALLQDAFLGGGKNYPTLKENLKMMKAMLETKWV